MRSVPLREVSGRNRPFLLPPAPERGQQPGISPLGLWHLLSLDAPTVAATWTIFIGWSAGVRLRWSDPVAMFLAVWILYAADRLLDARPLFTEAFAPGLEERHHFHHRYRGPFFAVILAAALPLVSLLHHTSEAVLHLDILLASLLGIWLLLVHARPAPSATAHRLPKELAVGLFFPAAVFIPTVARAPGLRASLLPDAVLFAGVCTLNCLFLYAWEHPRGRSTAHLTTRWAVRRLQALSLITSLSACALFVFAVALPSEAQPHWWLRTAHPAMPLLACVASGALLLALHRTRGRLSPLTLRALADFVLLTPIPIMLGMYVSLHHA